MKYRKLFIVLVLLLVLCIIAGLVACTQKSELIFEFTSKSNQDLDLKMTPSVTVTLQKSDDGHGNTYTQTAATNTITFQNIPNGSYDVSIMSKGFLDYTVSALVVDSRKTTHQVLLQPLRADIITFEGRSWRILERQATKILVISEYIIAQRRFDVISNVWENSELKKYINNDFYNSLSNEIKAKIIPNTNGDNIFFLSKEEADNYFFSDEDRIALDLQGEAHWWWLSTPGYGESNVTTVHHEGDIYLRGSDISYADCGVRPVMWLKI